jgi:hypothetical protein
MSLKTKKEEAEMGFGYLHTGKGTHLQLICQQKPSGYTSHLYERY